MKDQQSRNRGRKLSFFILNYNKKLAWFYVSQADLVQKQVDKPGKGILSHKKET